MTPLHFAADENEEEALLEHIGRGCDVNAADENGNTPLHFAAQNDHMAVLKSLLIHRADPTIKNKAGKSPIDVARKAKQELAVVELEASARQAAERQRIEHQIQLAEAQTRARQKASLEDAVHSLGDKRRKGLE